MATEKVVLIDGSAMLYRAFYAIPATFSTAAGKPTNATYGFALMFKKLLAGRAVTYGAVIFDAPGKTFRDEKFPAYKAQRPSMPAELRAQLDDIDRVVAAHRYPILRVPGFEADDVIGTLAKAHQKNGAEVVIVSGDKDFAQLIGDGVRMFDPIKDVTYDPELVRKKWGVTPEMFVDYLALVGDKVDNIPGVPGVGPKGAKDLLEMYGNLAGVLDNAASIPGKKGVVIGENRAQALLSKDLATIDCAVPLDDTLGILVGEVEQSELNTLYKELEFFSLLGREEVEEAFVDSTGAFRALTTRDDVQAFLKEGAKGEALSVLVLHDPPSPVAGDIAGFALSWNDMTAVYVPTSGASAVDEDTRADIMDVLADPSREKITHNVRHLHVACRRFSGRLAGAVLDIELASFLVEPTKLIPHDLPRVVREYLHRTTKPRKTVTGSGKSEKLLSEIPAGEIASYAGDLVVSLNALAPLMREALTREGQEAVMNDVELPLAAILADMELTGILVDPIDLKKMGDEFGERLSMFETSIHALAGKTFNIASTKQLSEVLFDQLKLPVIKKTKSGYSTDAEVLERLAPDHEIASLLLEHRKLSKLINTYTDVLQRSVLKRTGRVHTSFQQTTSATGRLITTDPDLQRTPTKTAEGKRIRETFIAPNGAQLVVADWSQIELRILAHMSGDASLVSAFQTGTDVHRRTAGQIFSKAPDDVTGDERNIGKTINFATIYGQGATALSQQLKIPRKDAERYIAAYFAHYAGVKRYVDETVKAAYQRGYVETILGRRRYVSELSSNAFMERQAGERIAANTPIQGSAADICKLAMLKIDRALRDAGLRTKMVLQIHDELIFETPAGEVDEVMALVREHMESAMPLDVPLVADVGVGDSWASAKP